jgi:hypothetical protein
MFDIAKFVLFISACAGLFGLTLFLFRDQINSRRVAGHFASRNPRSDVVEGELTNVVVMPIARPDAPSSNRVRSAATARLVQPHGSREAR